MEQNDELVEMSRTLRSQAILLGSFILAIWFIEIVDWILGGTFDQFGIVPRQISGLWGIGAAPLLHVGFAHVAANTLPFLILGWFVLLRGPRTFFLVTFVTLLVSGFGTWLIAPSGSIHLGASGLVFGYFGYLLFRGYFERSWEAIIWSVIVAILYGSMLLGIFSRNPSISWQMHFFGFLGGGLAAYLLANGKPEIKIADSGLDSH
ncbi:MAG: rhomboid family intramembrane serine protease [Candidatus Promineifilaceae bacterium]|nr:rhomboid family intramembrane serine protease [Candidatus Promineifilaceae bacterium]